MQVEVAEHRALGAPGAVPRCNGDDRQVCLSGCGWPASSVPPPRPFPAPPGAASASRVSVVHSTGSFRASRLTTLQKLLHEGSRRPRGPRGFCREFLDRRGGLVPDDRHACPGGPRIWPAQFAGRCTTGCVDYHRAQAQDRVEGDDALLALLYDLVFPHANAGPRPPVRRARGSWCC